MKRHGLVIFVFLAIAVFAGLAFYGDRSELLDQISSLPVAYWFIALGLALVNYVFRLVRWHYYLRALGVDVGFGTSAAIFMSGLSMAISPGRVGELAKSYFLREKADVPVAVSSAAVVAERVTDLISVLLLSLWGLTLISYGWVVAVTVLLAVAVFMVALVSPWGSDRLLRLPLPGRWKSFLITSRDSFRRVFSPKPLMVAMVLGLLAWFAEGCALWLVLDGMDASLPLEQAVSIYCVATLLGAITMLPGGLVGTEVGMVALLRQRELNPAQASGATFIIRVCTLWFAVAIGLLALLYVQIYMPKSDTRVTGGAQRAQAGPKSERGRPDGG